MDDGDGDKAVARSRRPLPRTPSRSRGNSPPGGRSDDGDGGDDGGGCCCDGGGADGGDGSRSWCSPPRSRRRRCCDWARPAGSCRWEAGAAGASAGLRRAASLARWAEEATVVAAAEVAAAGRPGRLDNAATGSRASLAARDSIPRSAPRGPPRPPRRGSG